MAYNSRKFTPSRLGSQRVWCAHNLCKVAGLTRRRAWGAFTAQPPNRPDHATAPLLPLSEHQKFRIFFTVLKKIQKNSQTSILRSLITNINSKTLFYAVVVAKLWFEQLKDSLSELKNAFQQPHEAVLLSCQTTLSMVCLEKFRYNWNKAALIRIIFFRPYQVERASSRPLCL
jgi:hypothetical protein